MKITDSEARKAAETLKKYCIEHAYCDGCIFDIGNVCKNCLLVSKMPFNWIKQLDTLRGYG